MRLHRLVLTGVGPFLRRQEIDFDELAGSGLFLIDGPTGSGKTTIIDAIVYALYGDVSGGNDSDSTRIRSSYCTETDPTGVTLDFSVDGRRHRVSRVPIGARDPEEPGRAASSKPARQVLTELAADGTEVTVLTRDRDIREHVQALLDMTSEQFRQLVVLPQGKFADLLRMTPTDRLNSLASLLDHRDLFQRVQEDLKQQGVKADDERRAARLAVTAAAQRLAGRLRAHLDAADETAQPDFASADSTDEERTAAVDTILAGLADQRVTAATVRDSLREAAAAAAKAAESAREIANALAEVGEAQRAVASAQERLDPADSGLAAADVAARVGDLRIQEGALGELAAWESDAPLRRASAPRTRSSSRPAAPRRRCCARRRRRSPGCAPTWRPSGRPRSCSPAPSTPPRATSSASAGSSRRPPSSSRRRPSSSPSRRRSPPPRRPPRPPTPRQPTRTTPGSPSSSSSAPTRRPPWPASSTRVRPARCAARSSILGWRIPPAAPTWSPTRRSRRPSPTPTRHGRRRPGRPSGPARPARPAMPVPPRSPGCRGRSTAGPWPTSPAPWTPPAMPGAQQRRPRARSPGSRTGWPTSPHARAPSTARSPRWRRPRRSPRERSGSTTRPSSASRRGSRRPSGRRRRRGRCSPPRARASSDSSTSRPPTSGWPTPRPPCRPTGGTSGREEASSAAAAAEDASRTAAAELSEAESAVSTLTSTIDDATPLAQELTEAMAARRRTDDTTAAASSLAQLATGRNTRSLPLRSYALQRRFASVLAAASVHLERMSSGKFSFELNEETSRGQAGLGISLHDAWTGHRQDPKSLSGGETFYAALSLALGPGRRRPGRGGRLGPGDAVHRRGLRLPRPGHALPGARPAGPPAIGPPRGRRDQPRHRDEGVDPRPHRGAARSGQHE